MNIGIDNLKALAVALVATLNAVLKIDGNKDGKVTLLEVSGFALPFLVKLTGYINSINWNELKPEAANLKLEEILEVVEIIVNGVTLFNDSQRVAIRSAAEVIAFNATSAPAAYHKLTVAFGGQAKLAA